MFFLKKIGKIVFDLFMWIIDRYGKWYRIKFRMWKIVRDNNKCFRFEFLEKLYVNMFILVF